MRLLARLPAPALDSDRVDLYRQIPTLRHAACYLPHAPRARLAANDPPMNELARALVESCDG